MSDPTIYTDVRIGKNRRATVVSLGKHLDHVWRQSVSQALKLLHDDNYCRVKIADDVCSVTVEILKVDEGEAID